MYAIEDCSIQVFYLTKKQVIENTKLRNSLFRFLLLPFLLFERCDKGTNFPTHCGFFNFLSLDSTKANFLSFVINPLQLEIKLLGVRIWLNFLDWLTLEILQTTSHTLISQVQDPMKTMENILVGDQTSDH